MINDNRKPTNSEGYFLAWINLAFFIDQIIFHWTPVIKCYCIDHPTIHNIVKTIFYYHFVSLLTTRQCRDFLKVSQWILEIYLYMWCKMNDPNLIEVGCSLMLSWFWYAFLEPFHGDLRGSVCFLKLLFPH